MKKSLLSALAVLLLTPMVFAVSNEEYDQVFPTYFEYCSGTQLKYAPQWFDGAEGGIGGHGFFYVHGLCKDYKYDRPHVKPCSEQEAWEEAQFAHKGVGISLDSDYIQSPWVAVPGRDLMLFGNLSRDQKADMNAVEKLAQEAVRLRVFENLKLKTASIPNIPFGTKEYEMEAARFSVGTDIAVNWARDLRCVRIPFPEKKLAAVAQKLNEVNDHYVKNDITFEWSMLKNNCTHLALNISHIIGMNREYKTDLPTLKQLGHLAVPANAYLYYVEHAVLNKFSAGKVKRSKWLREPLMQDGWIPLQAGSLANSYPVMKNNELFITEDIKGLAIPRARNPLSLSIFHRYDKSLKRSEVNSLDANLRHWQDIYAKEVEKLSKRRNLSEVKSRVKDYAESQLELIEQLLN